MAENDQLQFSPVSLPAVRGPDVNSRSMGWMQAALIVFAFAAPSAVTAVPYTMGMLGILGGTLTCSIVTSASVAGAVMLLHMKIQFPDCHTFGDLGLVVMGRPGEVFGNVIQLTNFFLFMPCALQFCANALEGIGRGIAAFHGCNDYYVFLLAFLCFLTTQARTFSNTQILTNISVLCVLAMGSIMILAAYTFDNERKVPVRWFGNPETDPLLSFVQGAGGITISAWAFIPAFVTVEISTCMADPKQFTKSLIFSGVLNVVMFVVVGVCVVSSWGYDVGEVIGITEGVAAFKPGTALNTAKNSFLLVGNFVSYMLDSVPLGRYCQKVWAPNFRDTWCASDIARYSLYTLPAFLAALSLSVFVPSVSTLLDFTTALSTPMTTQIFPAVLYWKLFRAGHPSLLRCNEQRPMTSRERIGVASVFAVGCLSMAACSVKAVGSLAIAELTPPMQIGCGSWTIWKNGRAR